MHPGGSPMRPTAQKTTNWLLVGCMLFAAYLVCDGFAFLLNPYSGRISTFACKTDARERTLCTVTIYGLRETYRRTFTAHEFVQAVFFKPYPSISSDMTYGITIRTQDEIINYIYAINPPGNLEQMANQINVLFVADEPVPDTLIVNNGFNAGLYGRGFLIVLSLLLAWYTTRTGRSWLVFARSRLGQRKGFWSFTVYWAKWNFAVRLIFYLATFFILGISAFKYSNLMADFASACPVVVMGNAQYAQFPWISLLGLYPLITILVLKAINQRQLLARVNINLPAGWVAAPLVASPLLVALAPQLTCDDCLGLKYLMAGVAGDYEEMTLVALVAYFILVGGLQWLALRKQLPCSFGWLIMPLINAALPIFFLVLLARMIWDTLGSGNSVGLYLGTIGMLLISLIANEIILGMYLSWLVNRKYKRLAQQEARQHEQAAEESLPR